MKLCGVLLGAALVTANAMAGDWNFQNDPTRINKNFELRFDSLPKAGELGKGRGWPSNYWPNYKGGIAHRWNSSYPNDFEYTSPSLARLRTMSASQINELSPAEKYDIFKGRYDYPTVKTSWSFTSRRHSVWYGICHGMSPSALHYSEPSTVTLTSADGITITFYSSDVKALMGHYYARVVNRPITQIGLSCSWGISVRGGCADVDAAAFHIMVGNMLGLTDQGFIADIDKGREKWNHTAYQYNTTVLSRYSLSRVQRNGAVSAVKVRTSISFAASAKLPSRDELIGSTSSNVEYHHKVYTYTLELNAAGEIVGGEWNSADHPDYLWYGTKVPFSGYFDQINTIYKTKY